MRSASVRALLLATAALCLAGCSSERHVTRPRPAPPPADSPSNAVRLFEWGWNRRNLDAFHDVLAKDFRFVFSPADSAGNGFQDHPFDRDTMLLVLQHLFVGGGTQPPATRIALNFDPVLYPLPDSRPGRDPEWHKEIVTRVDLTIKIGDELEYRIMGTARFFVVRGDSAVIPADLVAEGVGPDPRRWYIQQWNDETLSGGAAILRALPAVPGPASQTTWGDVLVLYRPVPVAPRH